MRLWRGGRSPFFGRRSIWNTVVRRGAPIAGDSAALVNQFATEAERETRVGTGPWIETSSYTTPIYTVPRRQGMVKVKLSNGRAGWRRPLQAAFERVPIPPGARPASGSDAHLTIWQPSTDRLWLVLARAA